MDTEFSFELPRGLLDNQGRVHNLGVMRLATADDELVSLSDPLVQAHESYVAVVMLSRVVLSIGSFQPITPDHVRRLFSEDFAYLQELFIRLNRIGRASIIETYCPSCRCRFELDLFGARGPS